MISAKELSLIFDAKNGPVEALSDITFTIEPGEFISIVGPSGCGKTSLLRMIAALQQPTCGQISVNGVSADEARRKRIYGYVFQSAGLFPWQTIEKNIRMPLKIMGYSEQEQRLRVAHVLELVGLEKFANKYPNQLSGGMQQRASIARALAFDAEILLMDEPFGALDAISREHLNDQLLNLWRSTGKTIVFITHSIPEAVYLSTKIMIMSSRPGKIIKVIESALPRDRPANIRNSPQFNELELKIRQELQDSFDGANFSDADLSEPIQKLSVGRGG